MSDAALTPAAAPAPSVTLRQLLLVPAIVVPLFSALPVWGETLRSWWKDYRFGDARQTEEQLRLGNRNLACMATPSRYYESAAKLAIDGTVCKSGDVLVRAFDENGHTGYYWVSAEKLKERIAFSASQVTTPPQSTAAASTPPGLRPASWRGAPATYVRPAVAGTEWPATGNSYLHYAQGQVVVLCTQRIDDRRIRQRVKRPDGCFDQVIDLANGAVISVSSAPCTC